MRCKNCNHEITKISESYTYVIRDRFGEKSLSNNLFKRGMKDVCRYPEPL